MLMRLLVYAILFIVPAYFLIRWAIKAYKKAVLEEKAEQLDDEKLFGRRINKYLKNRRDIEEFKEL